MENVKEATVYVAIEVSGKGWVLAIRAPHNVEKIGLHSIRSADIGGLLARIDAAARVWEGEHRVRPRVLCCYEAGYEGFWLARRLKLSGIATIVLDPTSLLVDRKAKKAKTDRIDAKHMVRSLIAFDRGDPQMLRAVRVPTVREEDRKRLLRERSRLVRERVSITNLMKGLLKLHGIFHLNPRTGSFEAALGKVETGYGELLPRCVRAQLLRTRERLVLIERQISEVEAERDELVKLGKEAPVCEGSATPERTIAALVRLRGVGPNDATILAHEVFYRDFANRRELASWMGLTPTPWASGAISHSQGIGRDGPTWVRAQLLQLTWRWIRFQPDSALSQWFLLRTQGASGRMRRIFAIALARKLLIALWRYATVGLVPTGARLV